MFSNKRTGAKAGELRAYASEGEEDAKRRLEAAGWSFAGVEYTFSDQVFRIDVAPDDADEGSEDDGQ